MTDKEMEDIAERAARKALASVGLDDEKAGRDLRDLRDLLTAWREVRCTVARTTLRWVTVAVLTTIALALGWKHI